MAGLLPLIVLPSCARAQDGREAARRGMVGNIRQLLAAGAAGEVRSLDARVLDALQAVPRHEFVPTELQDVAYGDHALPIGHEATISQPLVVAVMTQLARPRPDDVVLEVGTGSGYQAAVLAKLVRQVYSIELVEALARSAAERLARLGYANVEVRAGDGYQGWAERAPFDAIVVTAGAPKIPPALVAQLKPGGRMVIPVGPRREQQLTVVEKDAAGAVRQRRIMPVLFVPLRPGS
ncbi:protein-L-isoaspartate(D-aspartate) O-methyltransferase [Phenylobacterium sp.]|jgi:protein-L-isoaspartate(D-aspartate) O-methyltransferase|uniref:protein-L-isoaspartate(D-aspartate) O-methyltransferase n=1 Tax=Phenylobacterium sp. TaxID=1871053 RepID=UPI002E327E86|nr:protein-L-isoaspartate(D-aspartate) O-methyltransferase [Phenylobacterium sp.]HEX2559399.1 protein-L-isoaspartate(D-aspartate) O-methyltransferase [Phenylobacterium sp.]